MRTFIVRFSNKKLCYHRDSARRR